MTKTVEIQNGANNSNAVKTEAHERGIAQTSKEKIKTAPICFVTLDCMNERVVYWLQSEKMNEDGIYEKVKSGLERYEYAQFDLSGFVRLTLDDINDIAIEINH